MSVQVVIDITNGGLRSCPVCHTVVDCLNIRVHQQDGSQAQSYVVCPTCLRHGATISFHANEDLSKYIRRQTKESKKGEAKTAKEVKGYRTPRSGAGSIKGDVLTSKWMIEEKMTKKLSFSVTQKLISKAISDAKRRNPVVKIRLPKFELAVLLWDDFWRLIDETIDGKR